MEILVVGLNHEAAPVEGRERLSFGGDALPRSLAHLRTYVEEGVVLSTCNRTEVYGLAGAFEDGRQHIVEFLATERDVPASEFTRHLYTYCREAAVRHLFRDASGLDSMIVGEPQILGQAKGAYDAARDRRAAGRAVDGERLPEALSQTDIVISSTASPDFVLTADKVRSAMRSRGNRPLFLIDIAVPTDINPKVGG